jgi:hypothetical protein
MPLSSTRTPWDLYVITIDGSAELLTLDASGASGIHGSELASPVSWQPLLNPESPLAWAEPAVDDPAASGSASAP